MNKKYFGIGLAASLFFTPHQQMNANKLEHLVYSPRPAEFDPSAMMDSLQDRSPEELEQIIKRLDKYIERIEKIEPEFEYHPQTRNYNDLT